MDPYSAPKLNLSPQGGEHPLWGLSSNSGSEVVMTERMQRFLILVAAVELGFLSIEDLNRHLVVLLASERPEVAEAVEHSEGRGTEGPGR